MLAQVEPRGGTPVFALYQEEQGICHFKYANGVRATLFTGHTDSWEGYNRLIGEDGVVEPELSSRKALRANELIFATYESSRRHGRVELPLTIEDNPLDELVKMTK